LFLQEQLKGIIIIHALLHRVAGELGWHLWLFPRSSAST
jgi:hypothetical protein